MPCLFLQRQTLPVPVKQAAADTTCAFAFALVAVETRGGEDAVGEAGERKALEVDEAGARQLSEKETFAAKERVPETADKLDVVVNRVREGRKAAGSTRSVSPGPSSRSTTLDRDDLHIVAVDGVIDDIRHGALGWF